MGRLIDIDDERFWDILFNEAYVEGEQARRIENELNEIQSYDVDKIIDSIKKSYSVKTYKGYDTPIYLIPVDKVIEIIKGSGNDDT
jgi:nitrogen regulatory protein PII